MLINTHEGAYCYPDAINGCLNFFSKAGSLYNTSKKRDFYSGNASAKDLFVNAFKEDAVTAFKLLFWLRDCRGGAGNRSGARSIINYLATKDPKLVSLNMHLIPLYGRWDDLKSLFNTSLREEAGLFWANAIREGDVLAAKWAKREYKPIRQAMNLKESEFRKLLANIRKDHIVEHKMCQKEWNKIDFKKVPSVAMARYTRAFDKNAHDKFQAYKDSIVRGESTVHADTLFPHDCVRTARSGDRQMADLQFEALPNYLEGTDEKIMAICDTSGSMHQSIGGSVAAMDVSTGMALYCSSRLPKNSPFYKRFISFCSESKLSDWRDQSFSQALRNREIFNGAMGSTRIDLALKLILDIATKRDISQDLMPTTLLIVSDMQFSMGVRESNLTPVESMLNKFEKAGYKKPKIVYWNTAGYAGQPATVLSENVGLVSGFSPAICKAVFSGDDFSPRGIMLRAIEKYKVSIPTKEGVIEV